jgi:hypothetical protein
VSKFSAEHSERGISHASGLFPSPRAESTASTTTPHRPKTSPHPLAPGSTPSARNPLSEPAPSYAPVTGSRRCVVRLAHDPLSHVSSKRRDGLRNLYHPRNTNPRYQGPGSLVVCSATHRYVCALGTKSSPASLRGRIGIPPFMQNRERTAFYLF